MSKTFNVNSSSVEKGRPALTPEARENQLISLAADLAEEQLRAGTASSQIIVHFLKLGTENAKLERQKLEYETELVKAKTKAIQSSESSEKLYAEAIAAFKSYSGQGGSVDVDEEDIF